MRDTLVRINGTVAFPAGAYVKTVGHDDSFTITRDKTKARRFIRSTAVDVAERLVAKGHTRFTFDFCPAPEVSNAS